jgi:hypothetical protein
MVNVVGQGSLVVKKFREHGPTAVFLPQSIPDQLPLQEGYRVPQKELVFLTPLFVYRKTKALVFPGLWSVIRRRGGGEPPLIDAPPIAPQTVIIVGMQFYPPSGNTETPGNPVGNQPEYPLALIKGCLYL